VPAPAHRLRAATANDHDFLYRLRAAAIGGIAAQVRGCTPTAPSGSTSGSASARPAALRPTALCAPSRR